MSFRVTFGEGMASKGNYMRYIWWLPMLYTMAHSWDRCCLSKSRQERSYLATVASISWGLRGVVEEAWGLDSSNASNDRVSWTRGSVARP